MPKQLSHLALSLGILASGLVLHCSETTRRASDGKRASDALFADGGGLFTDGGLFSDGGGSLPDGGPSCDGGATLPDSGAQPPGGDTVTAKPTEIGDVLVNPGIGVETFHKYNSGHSSSSYPESSVAYFRWYWSTVEPSDGGIRFDMIDDTIKKALANDQTLGFRIMTAADGVKIPGWLKAKGINGWTSGSTYFPDHGDPTFMKYMKRLIFALGKRYDGHPGVNHVDIGSIGCWGEWNTACTSNAKLPSAAVKQQYVDWYFQAFPNTHKIMLIGGPLSYAVSKGSGWRADCLGDWGMFGPNWNHMQDSYPQALKQPGVADAWKQGHMAFEVCGVMSKWKSLGYSVTKTLKLALDTYHCSLLNAKSSPVPSGWMPAVLDFVKRAGYRFVLREVTHERVVKSGGTLHVETRWENKGVAPPYYRYPVELRLVGGSGNTVFTAESKADVRKLLPGKHTINDAFQLGGVPPGSYSLEIAVKNRKGSKPTMVRLAIKGKQADGWYAVSKVTVQ